MLEVNNKNWNMQTRRACLVRCYCDYHYYDTMSCTYCWECTNIFNARAFLVFFVCTRWGCYVMARSKLKLRVMNFMMIDFRTYLHWQGGSLILLNRLCADINVVDQTFKVCALRCVSIFTWTFCCNALLINIKQLSKLLKHLTQCLCFFMISAISSLRFY